MNKIKTFQFDDQEVSFKFSDRVARENGWTKNYSLKVIEEYKKFIFLCCVSEKGVTPSDPVDQVWHLHLTFTKSYWRDFCKNTLEKEIHHNPTKGGQNEAAKFDNLYTHLKQIYIHKFSTEPPIDIWQPNKIRFSDINFQRVNLKRYWLIKKPGKLLMRQLMVFFLVLTGLGFIQATSEYLSQIIFGTVLILVIIFQQKIKAKVVTKAMTADAEQQAAQRKAGIAVAIMAIAVAIAAVALVVPLQDAADAVVRRLN